MSSLLLHVCCAPCGAHIIEELKNRGFEVTAFFYNPNIFPEEEYRVRCDEIKNYCQKAGIKFIEMVDKHELWREKIKGYENEPEKGERCKTCYQMRLEKTVGQAAENKYDFFASTLAISPRKDASVINNIGKNLAKRYGLKFYDADWKKEDGFKKSCILSRQYNFYRQTYCGCEFSV